IVVQEASLRTRFTRPLKLIALVIVVFTLTVSKQNSVVRASQQEAVLADNGFRAEKDGFSFENYSNANNPVNLTADDMRKLYGDQVCGALDGDKCSLTPPAEAYMLEKKEAMAGGHCEGIAVLSLLLSAGTEKASNFGGDGTIQLPFEKNDKLTRTIAYYWATQR